MFPDCMLALPGVFPGYGQAAEKHPNARSFYDTDSEHCMNLPRVSGLSYDPDFGWNVTMTGDRSWMPRWSSGLSQGPSILWDPGPDMPFDMLPQVESVPTFDSTCRKHNPSDLGWAGNFLRNRLDSQVEKDNFTRYWLGQGDLHLTTDSFNAISAEISRELPTYGGYHIGTSSGVVFAYKTDFYSTSFDGLLGSAWVFYDKKGVPIGLFDRYDFNMKNWDERTLSNHTKTFGARLLSEVSSNCARPFNITYGDFTELP